MKQVLVITRHAIANYGSILQAIATQSVIQSMGYDCKIIDYIRKDEYKNFSLITVGKEKGYVKKFPVLLGVYVLARLKENTSANNKFQKMRDKWLKTTELMHDLNNVPGADIYVTGSDQVWGPLMDHKYDMNYFLGFVPDNKIKVSYAASFGTFNISDEDKEKIINKLKRYKDITVREKQAVGFLKDNGIEAKQVLDPTLLLSGDEWRKIFNTKEKSSADKYVLVYQIHKNDDLCEYALKVAEKLNLPLVRVGVMHHQRKWGGKFIETPDLKTFLEYIDSAVLMVTDSFHGTAFAINLNTPFVTLMPRTGTSSRNMSLLELTGLNDRIAKDVNDFSVLDKAMDFSDSNRILDKERGISRDVLASILENQSN